MEALTLGTALPIPCLAGALTVHRATPDRVDLVTASGDRATLGVVGQAFLVDTVRAATAADLGNPDPNRVPRTLPDYLVGRRETGLVREVRFWGYEPDAPATALAIGLRVDDSGTALRVGRNGVRASVGLHAYEVNRMHAAFGALVAARWSL